MSELEDLADEYEAGLRKCIASGYEEYGPYFQRRQQLIIDSLRFAAAAPPLPTTNAGGEALIHQWRQEAKRFRVAQEECDIDADQWVLNEAEPDRPGKCAR